MIYPSTQLYYNVGRNSMYSLSQIIDVLDTVEGIWEETARFCKKKRGLYNIHYIISSEKMAENSSQTSQSVFKHPLTAKMWEKLCFQNVPNRKISSQPHKI